jgi:glycosyltransferase involved in cell wall biosynthesis
MSFIGDRTDRPVTIVLVTTCFGRDGGIAAHVTGSATALRTAGFDVTVVAARSDSGACPGVAVHELPELDHTPMSEAAVARFSALMLELQPDIVHLHDLADRDLISIARRQAPTVASVHGYAGCTPNTYYFRPGTKCHRAHGPGCFTNMALRGCAHTHNPRGLLGHYRATTRRLAGLARVDHVIASSHAVASHLQTNGIERCAVVAQFSPAPANVVPPPAERRVMFAGRVVGMKGLAVLLKAAQELDCEIDVHGDGWWLPRARRRVDRLGIADRVTFHGWSDEPTLNEAYKGCRVVAVPSLWGEAFGLVGIEAMAHGRPVVASDTGGVREWLADGETGFLVPPGDPIALRTALNRLLDDYDLCARMGQAGAERAGALFTASAHVRTLEAAYVDAEARWQQDPNRD